ncbi:MAG: hypothetical protein ACI93R_001248 [Flavobacteriales bacterium]|jgi:hypothetical protein
MMGKFSGIAHALLLILLFIYQAHPPDKGELDIALT